MNLKEAWKLVAHCGLYCGECISYKGRIATMLARELKELIEAADHPDWVPRFGGTDFDYNEFLKWLEYYSKEGSGCYNSKPCRAPGGCGVPGCKIKGCTKEKVVEICFECDEFPCTTLSKFLENHPEQLKEYEKYKTLGRDAWLKEYAERAERGYCSATKKYYVEARLL
jgi:hypothetical protein